MQYLRLIKRFESLYVSVCKQTGEIDGSHWFIVGINSLGFITKPFLLAATEGVSLGLGGKILETKKTPPEWSPTGKWLQSEIISFCTGKDGEMHNFCLEASTETRQVSLKTQELGTRLWWYVFTITEDGCLYRHRGCRCGWLEADDSGIVKFAN